MPRGLHDPAGVIRTFRKVVTPWKGGAVVGRDSRSFIRRGRPRDVRVWRRRLGRAVAPRGSRRRLQKSQVRARGMGGGRLRWGRSRRPRGRWRLAGGITALDPEGSS